MSGLSSPWSYVNLNQPYMTPNQIYYLSKALNNIVSPCCFSTINTINGAVDVPFCLYSPRLQRKKPIGVPVPLLYWSIGRNFPVMLFSTYKLFMYLFEILHKIAYIECKKYTSKTTVYRQRREGTTIHVAFMQFFSKFHIQFFYMKYKKGTSKLTEIMVPSHLRR